jgi:hypothetical protein
LLEKLKIALRPEEVKLMEVEFDPNGEFKEMDVDELEKEFNLYKSGDYLKIYQEIQKINKNDIA